MQLRRQSADTMSSPFVYPGGPMSRPSSQQTNVQSSPAFSPANAQASYTVHSVPSNASNRPTSASVFASNETSRMAQFLREKGYTAASDALLRDYAMEEDNTTSNSATPYSQSATPINHLLANQQQSSSFRQPMSVQQQYTNGYADLLALLDNENVRSRAELRALLFPFFAHMYLRLIVGDETQAAQAFHVKYGRRQESYWKEDVDDLYRIDSIHTLQQYPRFVNFRARTFGLKMNTGVVHRLRPIIIRYPEVQAMLKAHIVIEAHDISRGDALVEAMSGTLFGEAIKGSNKSKVFFGVHRDDLSSFLPSAGGVMSKRAAKKEKDARKKDVNAPPAGRIPLPEVTDEVRRRRAIEQRDQANQTQFSASSLPSVCFYTLHNAHERISCAMIRDDARNLFYGTDDGQITATSLDDQEPLLMSPNAEQLQALDAREDGVRQDMTEIARRDPPTNVRHLFGHTNAIHGLSLSPDHLLLLSASADCTVRLWSTETWSNLCAYTLSAVAQPVWDVDMCSRGAYFTTGHSGGVAAMWNTERMNPLRLFVDHFGSVHSVHMHGNCNYVATACEDRCVRLFDVQSGNMVRLLTGHKTDAIIVRCSPCGRYIASGSVDGTVIVWDISAGKILLYYVSETGASIYSISFTRDSHTLAIGDSNGHLQFLLLDAQVDMEMANMPLEAQPPRTRKTKGVRLTTYKTKRTPIFDIHFTPMNLCIATGPFAQ